VKREPAYPSLTDLVDLEVAGEIGPQLRAALERSGITDLRQLHGRVRAEVYLLPGVGPKSIIAAMRKAGPALL
jgi:hypothetical protein